MPWFPERAPASGERERKRHYQHGKIDPDPMQWKASTKSSMIVHKRNLHETKHFVMLVCTVLQKTFKKLESLTEYGKNPDCWEKLKDSWLLIQHKCFWIILVWNPTTTFRLEAVYCVRNLSCNFFPMIYFPGESSIVHLVRRWPP